MTARFTQLVGRAIDETTIGLAFDARAVFVDLLLRVDYRSLRYVTTLTDYASFLRMPRRRLAGAIDDLERAVLISTTFPRGHDGAVDIRPAVYESCVRSRSTRAPLARHTRDTRADSHERTGTQARQISDVVDSQKSDAFVDRLLDIRDQWRAATGKSVTDDDCSRCLTYCRIDCINLGADFIVIDETLGKLAEKVQRNAPGVADLCAYLRRSVQTNAREALGLTA
jgi:hypothetical protein